MPNIRVMNWNIEKLSWTKMQINGMATAIARTVVAKQVDILVLLEVCKENVFSTMSTLAAALNAVAGGDTYKSWFVSHETGNEVYAFVVKDLKSVRPLQFVANANVAAKDVEDGTAGLPLRNLHAVRWTSWPDNHTWGSVPLPLPRTPRIPLVNVYARRPLEREASAKQFRGQTLQNGGYSEGLGYRMPCMALFKVHTANGNYILPIVCCHYAAVRRSTQNNFLAQSQVKQLPQLHIAQLYAWEQNIFINRAQNPPPTSGYLDIDGADENNQGTLIRNVIFTGDFNIDFQLNSSGGGASSVELKNRGAYDALTPTQNAGGSGAPAAQPGAAPQGGAPAVPFTTFNPPPISGDILTQRLRAAVTTQATIYRKYDINHPPAQPPANLQAIRGAAFDNFFYGGTEVSGAAGNFGTGGVDVGEVVDIAANIVQPGTVLAAGQIDVSGPATYYTRVNRRGARSAPRLRANVNPNRPLGITDRWLGARMVSDHLPVVLDFVCP